jgi:hypothetical protein
MQRQEQQQQQIPCGDDNKKSKSNSKSSAGMTTRNATATEGVVKYVRSCECWRKGNPLQFGFGLRLGKYGDMDEANGFGAACVFGDESWRVGGGECE